jgi:glycosyltransferase involved in cell wall biosynthesis
MRVLHVIPSLTAASGGPTAALIGLARAQAAAGGRVTVLAAQRAGEAVHDADALAESGVRVEVVGPCRGPLRRHPALRSRVRSLMAEHDVVHIHGVWEEVQFQAVREALARGVPFIIRPCGMLDEWSLARKPWKKRLYRWWRLDRMLAAATAVHCTTAMEAESTARACGKTPIIIEPNGIDLTDFAELPPRGRCRQEYGCGTRPIVLFLGRIHPGKGLEYLVPAMPLLRDRDAMVMVVGPDSKGYREVITALAREHGVADRMKFTGPLGGQAKVEALVDADVLALPSEHENFGNVVIEALAARCPVVVSDHVGAGAEVASRSVGSVVPLDPVQIAASLDDWLADEGRRRLAGETGRAFVFEQFAWPRIAAAWLDRYHTITEEHARSEPAVAARGFVHSQPRRSDSA